jgi:hypothetical protein
MPAIADQVAAIEEDLQAALAKVDSLMAENDALMKRLAASTADRQDLEAKNGEMQSVVDETRDLAHRLADMAFTMLRASRRQIGAGNTSESDGAARHTAALAGVLACISHTIEAHRGANQRKLLCSNDFSLIQGAPRCRQSVAQNGLILES